MLHFLQNLVYYMTAEVVQPRDHEMQRGLATARHMDEVISCLGRDPLCVVTPCVYIFVFCVVCFAIFYFLLF